MRDAQTSATLAEALTFPADAAHFPSKRFDFHGRHFDQDALAVQIAVGHIDQPPPPLSGLHRIRLPRMPAARNYGLVAGRTAGGSAGRAARRPAPFEDLHTRPSLTGKMTGKSYGPTEMIIRGLPGWLTW